MTTTALATVLFATCITLFGWHQDQGTKERPDFLFKMPDQEVLVRVQSGSRISIHTLEQLRNSATLTGPCLETVSSSRAADLSSNLIRKKDGTCTTTPLDAVVLIALHRRVPRLFLSESTFRLVPGIGKKLAHRIDLWIRSSPDQPDVICNVEQVRGIGPRLATRIRQLLTPDVTCP